MADTIKCPNCSANLRFDADSQKLICDFCGGVFLPSDIKEDLEETKDEAIRNDGTVDGEGLHEFVCNACGARVVTDENTSASFCAFCGSPALIGQRLTNEFRPKYIIPFKYGREKAVDKFFEWCKGGRYTPMGFISDKNVEKLTGLYVPFWLFNVDERMDIKGKGITVNSTNLGTRTRTVTSYYDLVRSGLYSWRKIPLDGETKIDDDLMEAIEPFEYGELIDYDFKYLPGFFADTYDLDDKKLHPRIINRTKGYLKEEFDLTVKKFNRVYELKDTSKFERIEAELALLPVWFLSYRYLGKTYNFAMNGQTGEVAGKAPVSVVKRFILFFLILAVLAVVTKIIVGLMLGGYVG